MKAPRSFETSETTYPTTQRYIQGDLIPPRERSWIRFYVANFMGETTLAYKILFGKPEVKN